MNSGLNTLLAVAVVSMNVTALAQEPTPLGAPAPTLPGVRTEATPDLATPAQTTPAPAADQSSHKKVADGPRFRFGVSSGAGPITGDYHFFYAGTDLRFGAQLNHLIGVYAQQQLGYYEISNSQGSMGTGPLLGVSAGADFTFIDRLFVGAGVGYAVFNSQAGPELHFRLGGYPLMKRNATKPRRHGLMLGTDFRIHFIQGGYTFIAPTFSLGYDAF